MTTDGSTARTVLIVDDDPHLLQLMGRFLELAGWVALIAPNGDEALGIVEHYPDDIDLLVTDVVMPDMDGFTLAAQIVNERPGIDILYMSGHFTDNARVRHGLRETGRFFLQKPFNRDEFIQTVDEALSLSVEAADAFAMILGHPLITAQIAREWRHQSRVPRSNRYDVALPIRYRLPGEEWASGVTCNISRSGVQFDPEIGTTRTPLTTGAPIELWLQLPHPGTRRADIRAKGHITRTSVSEDDRSPTAIAVAVTGYRSDIRRVDGG